jgi:hypothetical protein
MTKATKAEEPVFHIFSGSTTAHLNLALKSANELVTEMAQAEIEIRRERGGKPKAMMEI